MPPLNELLDRIKERRQITTETALAAALGVKKQTLSNWRHGKNMPDPVACETIAELAGEPLARVLGIVGEARALTRQEKAVWRKLAAAAAVAGIVLVLPGDFAAKSAAYVADSAPPNAYYVLVGVAVTLAFAWWTARTENRHD